MDISDCKHVCMLGRVPSCPEVPPTAQGYPCTLRQIICRIRHLRLPCEWHQGTALFIRSHKRLREEQARVRGFICHPYSVCTFYWQGLHMLVTFAVYIYIPFQVFMYCPEPYDPLLLFSDALTFLNVLGSFVTGYVDEGNKLIVLEPKLIAKHYLQGKFMFDLIASLPLQTIHIFDNCRYPSHTILLLAKLFGVPTFLREKKTLMNQLGMSYIKRKMAVLVIKMILMLHWLTYIHYQVPCFTIHYLMEDDSYASWLKRFIVVNTDSCSLFQKYIANLFLVVGFLIGSGCYHSPNEHLLSELILTAFMGLVGLVFIMYAFSSVLQLMLCRQYERNLYLGRSMELEEYMEYKRLPKYLQRKIHLFINYKYDGHYFNEQIIMNTINEQIKQDINMFGSKKMVMSVPLFQDMPIAVINAIIFSLTPILYMPGEMLVRYGQAGRSLYLISSGTVAVISATNKELAHLRDGSYFGETAVLHPGSKRSATIIALEITEIYKLDSAEFRRCLQPYPHLRRRLEDNYLKRRRTTLLHFSELAAHRDGRLDFMNTG